MIGGIGLLAIAAPVFGQGLTGNPERGALLAETWCSSCHIVSSGQTQGSADAPTFSGIAERSPEAIDALAAFLMDPHPPMPDLSLTREDIRDLLAYIASLN
jgi:mono/diheme cytochrome c family protein